MVIIFTICSLYLLYQAFTLMFWNDKFIKEKRELTPVHPELKDVKNGDELMVVNFQRAVSDPMLQSLKDRIDSGPEIDDPWDDDEDDGDGDVPALLKPRV